jgi:hypothetical protein
MFLATRAWNCSSQIFKNGMNNEKLAARKNAAQNKAYFQ